MSANELVLDVEGRIVPRLFILDCRLPGPSTVPALRLLIAVYFALTSRIGSKISAKLCKYKTVETTRRVQIRPDYPLRSSPGYQ